MLTIPILLCIFENQETRLPLIFPTPSELSDSEILKRAHSAAAVTIHMNMGDSASHGQTPYTREFKSSCKTVVLSWKTSPL